MILFLINFFKCTSVHAKEKKHTNKVQTLLTVIIPEGWDNVGLYSVPSELEK